MITKLTSAPVAGTKEGGSNTLAIIVIGALAIWAGYELLWKPYVKKRDEAKKQPVKA